MLAVVHELLVGDDPRGAVDRVQQGRCVALREDETIVRRALRSGEVVAEVPVDEDRHEIRRGHRRRRVAGLRGRAHADGVDAELLPQLATAVGVGHARHSRFAVPPFAEEVTLESWRVADLHELSDARRQRLGRLAVARDARDGTPEAAHGEGRGRRRHVEPDHLREGALHGRAGTTSSSAPSSSARTTRRRSSSRSRSRTCKRACDLLRPVWDAARTGIDGFVSIEVDPDLAYEREATFEQAKELHELVDRPNVYVKIPATARASARSRTRSPPAVRSTSR